MKKYRILLSFLFLTLTAFSQSGTDRIWDFPINPGTEEWKSIKTRQQRVDTCQIPLNILEKLNTKELAEICLNYPLFFEFTAFNDERKGISAVINRFNGLKELSNRKDGTRELINVYKNYSVLTQIQEESSNDYHTPYKLPFLELLLSNDAFVEHLDAQMTVDLGKCVLEKYGRKLENPHVYSVWNIRATFLLGAIVIEKSSISEKSPEEQNTIKWFIDNYQVAPSALLTEISKIISEL